MTKDLTRGRPVSVIIRFMLPILFGSLLQQVYAMVDTMIVGRFLGVDALGGVGSTGALNFLILGFCIGLCSGFTIPIANAFGAQDFTQLRKYVANAIYLCVLFCILVMAVVLTFCEELLTIMSTTTETFSYAYNYIYWIFWGIPFSILYNTTSAIIRSVGDSRTPLIFLILSTVLNLVLDILFIAGFHMGVAGAAWATNISQATAGLLCLVYIRRNLTILKFQPGDRKFHGLSIKTLLLNGMPMGLQYFVTAIGAVTLQSAINALGTSYVNAISIGTKIMDFFDTATFSLGTAMATFCGQNVGARRLNRVRSGLRVCVALSFVFCAISVFTALFFAPQLTNLFVGSHDPVITDLVRQYLLINSLSIWLVGFVNGFRFSIQGMGYPNLAILSGVMEMIARVLVGVVLVPRIGYLGACLGHPMAWVFADLFLLPAAALCLRHLRKQIPEDAPEN